MFFTFWGVSILCRPEKVRVKKSLIGKMFGFMMPRGSKKLGLSRMNFGGIGAKMIRAVMKKNGISSLEELIQSAQQKGVKFVACQMSMELMGITAEELIDGVELGGVATMILNANADSLPNLIEQAYQLRTKYKGNRVSIQLLTNVRSGNCTQNCAYCAQSRDSEAPIEKYRYVEDKKLYGDNDLVDEMHLARHCIGLSGIRFADDDIEKLAERIRKMKKNDTQICCSIGFLTEKQALILKEAGLNRINHNLNSSRRFYPSICTTHTYQERIDNLKMLKGLGFEICSGGIIGMGETPEDVVDMLFELLEINPDSVPINFLLPVEGTRLAERDISALTPEYCIKVLCLARLMLPKSDIRCAAGREVYFKGHEKTLFKVADSIFASGYLTEGGQSLEETFRTIEAAGFTWQVESESSH